MNLGELMLQARKRARDNREPYLIDDELLIEFCNQAVLEACERSHLIRDEASPFCTISVVADTAEYPLDSAITHIDRVRLGNNNLTQVTATELDRRYPMGWSEHKGQPKEFMVEKVSVETQPVTVLTLYPNPEADATLHLEVYRRPLESERMAINGDYPPIDEQYHRDLLYWVLYEMFSVQDVDVADPGREAKQFALFESRFGVRKSARWDQVNAMLPPHATALPQRFV